MEREPPIATATIARIYMKQGLLREAEALYSRLLEQSPGDERLEQGLQEVRARIEDQQRGWGDCQISLTREPGRVSCSWKVSELGRERAGKVLGRTDRLALRLVAFPLVPGRPSQDIEVQQSEGTLSFKPPRQAQLLSASIGLLGEGERFVSIAHCEMVALGEGDELGSG